MALKMLFYEQDHLIIY